jgi:hypothetical protein
MNDIGEESKPSDEGIADTNVLTASTGSWISKMA